MQKVIELERAHEHNREQTRHSAEVDEQSARGLLLIGLFKISKSLGCILLGATCLHLIHRDLGSLAMQVTDWLGLDPEGHLATFLLDKADLINGHQLRITGALSFAGGAIYAIEGTGLMLRKVWAEYVTVILTTVGLPWEIYEMLRQFSPWKAGLFVANLLVLAFLLWILQRKRKEAQPAHS